MRGVEWRKLIYGLTRVGTAWGGDERRLRPGRSGCSTWQSGTPRTLHRPATVKAIRRRLGIPTLAHGSVSLVPMVTLDTVS